MAFDFNPATFNIDGVNFSDYILDKNSYNPLIFVRKKSSSREKRSKLLKESHYKETCDKYQQFDYDKINANYFKTIIVNNSDEIDPVLQQTIKFAKDIVPLTIPADASVDPVYYTIKSKKTCKRKHGACEHNLNSIKDGAFDKSKSKVNKNIKQQKLKCNIPTTSTDESPSRSIQNNTIDDVNENRSLSYTLSEASVQSNLKKDKECSAKNKKYGKQKIMLSESFEGGATEYMNKSSETYNKKHVLNERDQTALCENITSPVITTIKECFSKLKNQNGELKNIFTALQNHSLKLDTIFDKLSNIESKLEAIMNKERNKVENPTQEIKSSKLEEIGRDIISVKEYLSSEEELAYVDLKSKNISPLTTVHSSKDLNKLQKYDSLARGENTSGNFKEASLGTELERPNRVPARFCWTDVAKKPSHY